MHQSEIKIQVQLDNQKMPETLHWQAPDGGVQGMQECKAILLGLWDGQEKSALRIDLWTKKMMVDEMADFFYQTMVGMADTYARATRNAELAKEMKAFASTFHKKAFEEIRRNEEQDK
jgi:gliding motility-associated protein GldC